MSVCTISSIEAFIINCIAHWSEGNTNYLIGRVESNEASSSSGSKPTYKCIMYSEMSESSSAAGASYQRATSQDQYRHARHKNPPQSDLVDFSSSAAAAAASPFPTDNIEIFEKSTLQISVSPFEFCRSIDAIMDEQFSFTFSKGT